MILFIIRNLIFNKNPVYISANQKIKANLNTSDQ